MNECIGLRDASGDESLQTRVLHQMQGFLQLCDTLLSRLISGQLRLPDAEALLEGAL